MTSGRWLVLAILLVTAVFAGAQWWFQTRAWYAPIEAADLHVTTLTGEAIPLAPLGFEWIDAETSPLRFRACFTLDAEGRAAAERGAAYDGATPLNAPGWFECFDAAAIGQALEAGEARAVLAEREISDGVDRVLALFPDGRAYGWHQLNGTLGQ
jgi:hypothetical protein